MFYDQGYDIIVLNIIGIISLYQTPLDRSGYVTPYMNSHDYKILLTMIGPWLIVC